MIEQSRKNTLVNHATEQGIISDNDSSLDLRWTYNYFSLKSDDSVVDWRENLSQVLRDALNDEE